MLESYSADVVIVGIELSKEEEERVVLVVSH